MRGPSQRVERVRERERLAEDRRDPEVRRLLMQTELILPKELGDTHGQTDLMRDRLRQHDLIVSPRARRRSVERQNADQLVEDDDRNGECSARSNRKQLLSPADRPVFQLGRGLDVSDSDGPAVLDREVRDRKLGPVVDRLQPLGLPLSRRSLATSAEPDEAALHPELVRGFLDRHT